jgi:hypothetical protein
VEKAQKVEKVGADDKLEEADDFAVLKKRFEALKSRK